MGGGRGFATAVVLILIALTCIAFAKRIERERRLLRKFRDTDDGSIRYAALTEDERDTAESLCKAGVLSKNRARGYTYLPEAQQTFRRKRIRFALSGALAALALGVIVAFALLS
jgi:hypothetical protein